MFVTGGSNGILLTQTNPCFYVSAVQVFFENIVSEGALTSIFSFQMFSTLLEIFLPFL